MADLSFFSPRLTNLITGGTLVTYITICVNYLFFYRALKRQGYNRAELPYCGWFQPWGTWVALIWLVCIEIFYGYEIFLKGHWDIGAFFSHYTMGILAICTCLGWKIGNRTRLVAPEQADLVWARPEIDRHEAVMQLQENWSFRRWFGQKLKLHKYKGRGAGSGDSA